MAERPLVTYAETGKETVAEVTSDENGTLLTVRDGAIETVFIPAEWPD